MDAIFMSKCIIATMIVVFIGLKFKGGKYKDTVLPIASLAIVVMVFYFLNQQYHFLEFKEKHYVAAGIHCIFWFIIGLFTWIKNKSFPIILIFILVPFTAIFLGFGAYYILNKQWALGIFLILFVEGCCWGFLWPRKGGMTYTYSNGWIEIYANDEIKSIVGDKEVWTTQDMDTELGQRLMQNDSMRIITMNCMNVYKIEPENLCGYKFMNLK